MIEQIPVASEANPLVNNNIIVVIFFSSLIKKDYILAC